MQEKRDSRIFERDTASEKKLGDLFLQAHEGKITLVDLREKAKQLEDVLQEGNVYNSSYSNLLLKRAFHVLEQLHDSSALEYFREHPDEFLSYAEQLLGRKKASFTFLPRRNVKIEITYRIDKP